MIMLPNLACSYNASLPWPVTTPNAYIFGDGGAKVTAQAWGMTCGWEGDA